MLVVALPILAAACEPGLTSVRYRGIALDRPIVPVTSIEVFRTGKPIPPAKDLGVVTVACPGENEVDWFGSPDMPVGCTFERAVWLATAKAAGIGANGIHSIVAGTNKFGSIESLRATAFFYEGGPSAPAAPAAAAQPNARPTFDPAASQTVEERLKRLEKLKNDNLITPEEYAEKRAEILKDI
jgi:hypothetical protein